MMSVFRKYHPGLFALLSLYGLLACGGIDNAVTRTVAESVTLEPAWTVLPIAPPLEVRRTGQKILMRLDGVRDWVKPFAGPLLLRDGSSIDIEVELTDQTGQRHSLVPISIGASIGFGLAQPEEGAGFFKNRRFVELRVRGSRPILAQRIDWYCWTGK
ncbi:MAG: hypothetical protein H6972_02710 [Gammaproteobacteria bacterium]|nr:hypothetical protein [Gammaproteobacteria bacterium]